MILGFGSHALAKCRGFAFQKKYVRFVRGFSCQLPRYVPSQLFLLDYSSFMAYGEFCVITTILVQISCVTDRQRLSMRTDR